MLSLTLHLLLSPGLHHHLHLRLPSTVPLVLHVPASVELRARPRVADAYPARALNEYRFHWHTHEPETGRVFRNCDEPLPHPMTSRIDFPSLFSDHPTNLFCSLSFESGALFAWYYNHAAVLEGCCRLFPEQLSTASPADYRSPYPAVYFV